MGDTQACPPDLLGAAQTGDLDLTISHFGLATHQSLPVAQCNTGGKIFSRKPFSAGEQVNGRMRSFPLYGSR